jgi:hypothetical protein
MATLLAILGLNVITRLPPHAFATAAVTVNSGTIAKCSSPFSSKETKSDVRLAGTIQLGLKTCA